MSRTTSGTREKGKPVVLPEWWLDALRRRCAGKSGADLAEELTAATKRRPPFRREAVNDFLAGRVLTDAMMKAFLSLYRDMPPPLFLARSYEEAHRLQELAKKYDPPVEREVPRLSKTDEHYVEPGTDTAERRPGRVVK